jgi:glycosyltransferase involved in cell wall biosynthesis
LTVCYVYQDQYPWDIRIEKITEALAESGTDVHIVSRNRSGVPPREQLADRIHVHRVAQGFDRISRTILNFPAFFSPAWLRKTVSTVEEECADVIIVRDLPLGPMAYWAGKLTGRPVMMDMAENYPAMIQDTWTFRGPRPIDYLCRNPRLLRTMERWLLPRLDGFLVVSDASANRVRTIAGLCARVSVVGNTPRIVDRANHCSHPLLDRLRKRAGIALLYVGGLEESRGLETVIEALPEVTRGREDFLFVVVGQGSSHERLKKLARDRAVDRNVLLAGWLEPAVVPAVIAESDLCIVPHYVTEHTDTTLPNKLFDYMLQKKPVLVTQSRSLRQIVETHRCGRVYPDRDPAALARAILELADPDSRKALGEAGFRAVQNEYNWERDKPILLSAVEAVAGRRRIRAEILDPEERLESARSVQ